MRFWFVILQSCVIFTMMNKISTVRLFCAIIDLVCLTLSLTLISKFLSVKKQVKVMFYRISFPLHCRNKSKFVDLENIWLYFSREDKLLFWYENVYRDIQRTDNTQICWFYRFNNFFHNWLTLKSEKTHIIMKNEP